MVMLPAISILNVNDRDVVRLAQHCFDLLCPGRINSLENFDKRCSMKFSEKVA
jgi:hypothetical protein